MKVQIEGKEAKVNGKDAVYFYTDKLTSNVTLKVFGMIVKLSPTREGYRTLVIDGNSCQGEAYLTITNR